MKKVGREVLFLAAEKGPKQPGKVWNTRNGESAFIRLLNGDILFAYTEYWDDSRADDANACIAALISHDEGETFGEKRTLFVKPEGCRNIMSVSFLRMGNGDVGIFFIIKNGDETDKIVLSRSSDEGKTWSEPISVMDCLPEQDYFVLNNDRVIMLQHGPNKGRIIVPVARHSVHDPSRRYMPGVICFFLSDDDGRSWYQTEQEIQPLYPSDWEGMEEPGLYEFENGELWCYIRTQLGFQFRIYSADSGLTWTAPEPYYFFTSPCSPMLVKKMHGQTLAVFNPIPGNLIRDPKEVWDRTPYVLAVSDDDGRTFTKEKLFYIEDDLTNGYCYPAMIEVEGGFLLTYYHSNGSGHCLNSSRILKISMEELG